ncbi:L,D-transpeptidase family protein [Bradyrhizobium prioriisuperbiae]|uniref:L,D-transpeptidase family protein n=1 Tax=Bradyrhizobium prioriisuperbiae TaxID=2854389 RepID=UPI0028E5F8B3|nr:L,D-transpeptidase family protein [Bradyrhizobium prioritasuperba]
MDKRILTIFAVAAAGLAGTSAALAQGYPQGGYSQGGYAQGQAYTGAPAGYTPPGAYPADSALPDFDAIDDDAPQAPSSTALSTPGPAPRGPVMSPDDPRYGRPSPPPVYSNRPADGAYVNNRAPAPSGYGAGFIDPSDRLRPPGAIDGQGGQVTGSLNPPQSAPMPLGPDGRPNTVMSLPEDEQPETGPRKELPERLRRQEVNYVTKEPPGTIIVDTPNTQLYYVLGNNRAVRYGVRVGRDGFTWTGVQKITRKAEWPDWHPPPEMIERQPYLPRFMAGGDGNPLGARAMYLGSTVYRIHGTNQPSTIGQFVSSGCIGMLNEDVTDLFERTKVGTRVVVLPGGKPPIPAATTASAAPVQGQYQGQYNGQAAANIPGTGPTVVPPLPAPVTVR